MDRRIIIISKLVKVLALKCIIIGCAAILSCNTSAGKNKNRYVVMQDNLPISVNIFKTNIEKYVDYWPRFEFAVDDSDYILCWWSLPNDPYEKRIGKALVFNFKGEIVDATEGTGNTLKEKFIDLFPSAKYRQKWIQFTESTDGYGFSNDECYALRLNANLRSNYWGAELWSLCDKRRRIWKINELSQGGLYPTVKFIEYKKKKCILVAFTVGKAYLLSEDNGQVIDSFEYGPANTEELLKERANRLHIQYTGGFNRYDLDFSASSISYNDQKRLLAVGDGHSQRVRIISVDSPHKMILEINSNCHYRKPDGGQWLVSKLCFSRDGKYLVVGYWFHGGKTPLVYKPTEIFNADTWQCCWFENSETIRDVTLSPDGNMILFRRDMVLELNVFNPNPRGCGSGCQ